MTNRGEPTCGVDSTFNFAVGTIAIVAAIVIGYLIYQYWVK